MNNFLDELNDAQREAATAVDGPLLIIAGAGSGKTKVLTYRVAYSIARGIPPKDILAVTFTNKAAGEMKERIKKLLKKDKSASVSGLPWVGTFHAFCVQILRREAGKIGPPERSTPSGWTGWSNRFVIYDEEDQIGLVKEIIEALGINKEQFKPTAVLNEISRAKSELVDDKDYFPKAQGFWQEKVAAIYQAYQKRLKENNAFDFDDLIMMAVKIFQCHPGVLEKYQNRYRYISVDEYQDTNYAQYVLVKLLAQKFRNLCVVGDDWQSIYSFRGADFRNILNFEQDWPEARVVKLEENYRSSQNILDAAHEIIVRNKHRKEKRLWTKNPSGAPVFVTKVRGEKEEAAFIVEKIREQRRQDGLNFADFTVLYRTNAQSRAVEEAFLRAGLPYKLVGAIKFYQRKEIKDILAYLRFVLNPLDSLSLNRIVNAPPRGIGKAGARLLDEAIKKQPRTGLAGLNRYLPAGAKNSRNFQNFCEFIAAAQKFSDFKNLSALFNFLIKNSGYENYLAENLRDGEIRLENVRELLSVAQKYDAGVLPAAAEDFLQETALLSDADEVENGKNVVNLMTLHSAKGLEFSVVFIAGCEEGLFPHSRCSTSPSELEEERRLAYVGVTRAKKEVYLIFTQHRQIYGATQINPPSRFLLDIPSKLIRFDDFTVLESEDGGQKDDPEDDNYEDFERNIVKWDGE